jgi:small-conductance mechanosensitive channel
VSTVDTVRSVVSHRGMSCLELHRQLGEQARELRQLRPRAEQATAMEARIDEQAMTIVSLREQLAAAKKVREDQYAKAARCDDADRRAEEAERQLDEQMVELVALRQFKANVTSVSSLPEHDPDPDDQDTGTFNVTALWDARDAGLLGPVTDPGRIATP